MRTSTYVKNPPKGGNEKLIFFLNVTLCDCYPLYKMTMAFKSKKQQFDRILRFIEYFRKRNFFDL